MLAVERDWPMRRQAQPDYLQGFLYAADRMRVVEPVGVDVHPLAGTDSQDGCARGEV